MIGKTHRALFQSLELFAAAALFAAVPVFSRAEQALAPDRRFVPGEQVTPFLRYENPTAKAVKVTGSWNKWAGQTPMQRDGAAWVLDMRTLKPLPGRHDYKFLPDGNWEPGDNRFLFLNEAGEVEKPPDVVASAEMKARDEIVVHLKKPLPAGAAPKIRIEPEAAIATVETAAGKAEASLRGYAVHGDDLSFTFDPAVYGKTVAPEAKITVAGSFNYWNPAGGGPQGQWMLKRDGAVWTLTVPKAGLKSVDADPMLMFKFVVDGQWMQVPPGAPNAQSDGKGNTNLRIDGDPSGSSTITIKTAQPLPLDRNHVLVIEGLADRRVRHMVAPGAALDEVVSTKPLGAVIDRTNELVTFRLFAPRATAVHLCLFDTPHYEVHLPKYERMKPAARYPMARDAKDGVWEISTVGLSFGRYYTFNVEGPPGDGEGFMGEAFVGDPYAKAAAHAENNGIVMDLAATNQWFGGWTDSAWRAPKPQDMVIYEAHLRDLTIDPSSGVSAPLRGTYEGLIASAGTGTGLDHLKTLGVNMIEFLPLEEFNNGPTAHNWGYSTVFYFSPEASYARDPLRGSQVYEMKRMINELHRQGFGVIMDVVYNHVGSPNIFTLIDRKYYFRLTPDWFHLNFSGVGNDVRSEAPMMRRMIVDNMVYFAKEYRVDGFRLDLAELIDLETLKQAREAVLQVNPNAIVISEPWSFRGEHKQQLRGTGWSAWNNDFRYAIKDFVRGRADRNHVKKVIAGSTELWTANPLQAVNYVESHDDYALVDELSGRDDKDGRNVNDVEARMNRLCAAVLFTSFGIPMINNGQEFLRSKRGIHNTYDKGDEVNAIRWGDRQKPMPAQNLAFYTDLIRLRSGPEGRSFRATSIPAGYLRWIEPQDGRLLGMIVNAPRTQPGSGFVVLYNAANVDADFEVPLPTGNWRMVCDGTKVEKSGVPGGQTYAGGQTISVRVPFGTAVILMDGF